MIFTRNVPLLLMVGVAVMYSFDVSSKAKPMDSDTTEFEGVIMKMVQENPPGSKIKSYTDFYIQAGLKNYFIKICESKLTEAKLKELVGLSVKASLSLRDGFWDMCGDKIVQSRTGPYAAVHSIEVLKDKRTYHFYDGNNNHYTITSGMVKYDPVRKEKSSSGVYDGGKPARAVISEEQFDSILKIISAIEKDGTIRASSRMKGTGAITVSFSEELRKFSFMKGAKMDLLENELKSVLNKK